MESKKSYKTILKIRKRKNKHTKKQTLHKADKLNERQSIFNTHNPNKITEFDEFEMLCIPSYVTQNPTYKANHINFNRKFPENYNFKTYSNLNNDEERRKYRDSKDLRNNLHNNSPPLVGGICFQRIEGRKCLDPLCTFGHEFRHPKKLRLCSGWMNGNCADGQFCLYLHSEYPCRFHYLGLKHDSNKCRYYHGGSLSKEYEEMFLNSIDLNRMPKAREMYENQAIQLRANIGNNMDVALNLTVKVNQDDSPGQSSNTLSTENRILPTSERLSLSVSNQIVNEVRTYVDNEHQSHKSSDDENLQIDESFIAEQP